MNKHFKLITKKLRLLSKKKSEMQRRLAISLIAVGLFLGLILVLYIVGYIQNNKNVSHFLPAEKVIAYVQLKDLSLPAKLNINQEDAYEKIELVLKNTFDIDYKDALRRWATGPFGVAYIENNNQKEIVGFLRTKRKRQAIKFFEEIKLENEELIEEDEIYSYPESQNFNFSFIGPYCFISQNKELLKEIQFTYETGNSLNEKEEYKKSFSNLPRSNWLEVYTDFKKLDLNENLGISNLIEPLKLVINNIGLSVRKEYNGFHFNSFININPELLALNKGYNDSRKFSYELTDHISSKNLILYIGGANLSDEWQNTLKTISNLNPAYGIILEGILNAQVDKIFGNDVSLRNDIYPIFEGEYAFAIGLKDNGQIDLKLILGSKNKEFSEKKLEKLSKGFNLLAAQFAPRLLITTLPDGTESREIIADDSKTSENSEEYKGNDINCVGIEKSNYGFCYTTTEKYIVMTNNHESAIETIDTTISSDLALSEYQPFREALGNLSKINDEISFLNLQSVTTLIKEQTPYGIFIEPFLNKFDATTWVKHYFDDGVSTEGYVLIK